MAKTAKLFRNGRSQAVRLPAEFRFEGTEVLIRRDLDTGAVILTPARPSLTEWLELRQRICAEAPDEVRDFEVPRELEFPPEREWP